MAEYFHLETAVMTILKIQIQTSRASYVTNLRTNPNNLQDGTSELVSRSDKDG